MLLASDGKPADIDECDPQRLCHAPKQTLEKFYSEGVMPCCLTLDANGDAYGKRIFGAKNYTIVEHVQRRPKRLPHLLATLTA